MTDDDAKAHIESYHASQQRDNNPTSSDSNQPKQQ